MDGVLVGKGTECGDFYILAGWDVEDGIAKMIDG